MQRRLLLLLLALLALTVVVIFILVMLPERSFDNTQELETVPVNLEAPPITFIDPIRGGENARITVVQYSDFACPLCHSVEDELQAFIAENPRQRRLVWKDAPNTGLHPTALSTAMAARCAQDQGQFWEYHDRLFQEGFSVSAERLSSIAADLGLNVESFENCMASEVTRPVVEHTLDEAIALGVTGTPTLFINGDLYNGAITVEALNRHIQSL